MGLADVWTESTPDFREPCSLRRELGSPMSGRQGTKKAPLFCGERSPQGNARTCLEHRPIDEGWATPTSRATCGSRSGTEGEGENGAPLLTGDGEAT